MANSILAKMAVQISANTAEFNSALKNTSGNLKSFTSNVQNAAGAIGIAFGVQQISSFAIELTKLAGEAEGVRAAFDRLPNSVALMAQLKEATHNTVSELDLMKRSVQASNFDISLSALPKLLEFATLRAQQTGQSVDYLVDSIVTGIGRKSPLILDNLGISATALKEKLNGVSLAEAEVADVAEAVGAIAKESLGRMGEYSDNAATSIQQLSAAWEDLKIKAGNAIASIIADPKNANALLTNFKNQLIVWGDESISVWDKIFGSAQEYADMVERINMRQKQLANPAGPSTNPLFTGEWLQQTKQINKELKQTAKAVEEVFKSKANLDFRKDLEPIPDYMNIHIASRPGFKMPDKVGGPDISGLKSMAQQVKEVQADLSMSTADFVTDMADTIGASIAGVGDFGKGFLISLAKFAGMFGKQLIALGFAQLALKKSFTNPVAAIAAGTALVIAASAISSSISNFNSGSYSGGGSGGSGRFDIGAANRQDSAQTYEFRVRGSDLVAAMTSAQQDNRLRKGG